MDDWKVTYSSLQNCSTDKTAPIDEYTSFLLYNKQPVSVKAHNHVNVHEILCADVKNWLIEISRI